MKYLGKNTKSMVIERQSVQCKLVVNRKTIEQVINLCNCGSKCPAVELSVRTLWQDHQSYDYLMNTYESK